MKLVVIDHEWLEKQIDQQETLIGMSKDRMGREAASAISHTLQRVRSATSPIESHIDAAYKAGYNQCKKENGYET